MSEKLILGRNRCAVNENYAKDIKEIDFRETHIGYIDYKTKVKTDVECPKCKQLTWKRIDRVLTSEPPKYQYECPSLNCGWIGWFIF